jgi:streptomycin 6-kinase
MYVLAAGLPAVMTAPRWPAAWIGLDTLEAAGLIATGLLAARGDRRHALAAAATTALLVVDAWFDAMTATSTSDLGAAIAMALCPELPLAAVCGWLAIRASQQNIFDLDRCVVVHGDPHPGNALRAATSRPGAESGFVFVDPDGFLAEPAYDLGVVLRDWCPQLLAGDAKSVARRYCALLAEHSGVDETAIWEWGFLERVSTGLFVLAFGAGDVARPFLETAELLV